MDKKIRIKLKSFDHNLIDKGASDIVRIAKKTGSRVHGPIPLPVKRSVYTVVRGPHVNKSSREQFELKVHKRLIDISEHTSQLMDELNRLELPSGVEVEIKA